MAYLGIDPGQKTFGIALLGEEDQPLLVQNWNPEGMGGIHEVIDSIEGIITQTSIDCVAIERFVAYKGVTTSASEDILMLIGALREFFHRHNIRYILMRAIDWKPVVCKNLVRRYKFDNPSFNFDKKFSVAAAKQITGETTDTNHEADAICIAYYAKISSATS